MMENVAVLGDGAWGTALSMVLAERGASVIQWSVSAEYAAEMQASRANPRYLPDVVIPDGVTITSRPEAFGHADLIVSAVPSRFLREVLTALKPSFDRGRPFVSATKGLEFPSYRSATQIIESVLGKRPMAVVSGPSHAEEVAQHVPTAVVAASSDPGLALRVQDLLTTEHFRVYTSSDPVGVELGGALKNVLAIAGGLVDGLGLGDNTKAALLVRGQTEMTRLGVAMGAKASTFQGLSGIGDLVVSCISPYGRNRLVGECVGRGESLEDILTRIPGVPEGVLTCKAAMSLAADHGVEMPITQQINEVLYGGKNPRQAVTDLMTRQQKDEITV
jgi:glycerol-3-phosphate dehydrogenase (NAD(P)+)